MTKTEAVRFLYLVVSEFPLKSEDIELKAELWSELLEHVDYSEAKKGFIKYIKDGNKYFPKVTDLVELKDKPRERTHEEQLEFIMSMV